MIGNPPDPRQIFDDLLSRAQAGQAPPTESGLDDAVINALYLVVAQRTTESTDNAMSVFEQLYR